MTQPWPAPPAPVRSRNWLTATLAAVAVVIAAAALIVALTRSGPGSTPTYTSAQKAEAKKQLCEQYELAVYAVRVESHATDNAALARIAETNGAAILEIAAGIPALDAKYRDAAQALAAAFRNETALGSRGGDDPRFQAAVDGTNAKGSVMQGLCGD
ncbi:hypothetical protein [Mycolicibacter sinensis]|jgi:hypothetical protein|uniref:Alanine and proline rich membrane protein n=1 Tax=Mycolicibacter sinensis (strain JDM601) TaxID=875328 RepID=A0A1A2ECD9_MYCSD|nr:hypothetical protein [Mycolicibacter sinensis]OBG03233.1 hypothetical protein A5771_14745 [Mycolicibacter sinensis]OBG04340.1 hypothetical protein A5772_05090 [Mycolicibacter sinensis]